MLTQGPERERERERETEADRERGEKLFYFLCYAGGIRGGRERKEGEKEGDGERNTQSALRSFLFFV